MAITMDQLGGSLDKLEIRNQRRDSSFVFGFTCDTYINKEGDQGALLVAELMEDGKYFRLFAPSGFTATGPHADALLKACMMFQWRTKLIQFEFDANDGEVRPMIEFPLMDNTLTQDQLGRCIGGMVSLLDDFYPTAKKAIDEGKVRSPLGRGGFGTVYRALCTLDDVEVAFTCRARVAALSGSDATLSCASPRRRAIAPNLLSQSSCLFATSAEAAGEPARSRIDGRCREVKGSLGARASDWRRIQALRGIAAQQHTHLQLERLERLCPHRLALGGAKQHEVAVGRVPVDRQRSIDLIEDPVVRHARLMVAAELRHRVHRAVGVAHDLADEVRTNRDRSLPRRRRHAVATPAREVGAIPTAVEHDVDLRGDPPAAWSAGTSGAAVVRAGDCPRRQGLCGPVLEGRRRLLHELAVDELEARVIGKREPVRDRLRCVAARGRRHGGDQRSTSSRGLLAGPRGRPSQQR